jgi:phospholipase/carboxylesterase
LNAPSVAARRLLVFFHGAGGRAARSLPLVRDVAESTGCIVLLPTSAATTWDVLAGGWGPDVVRLDAALAVVFAQLPIVDVAFGGFSDGASYALSIGLANGDLATALIAFSPGFEAAPERVGAPRVWVSHGTEDPVLPIDRCSRPLVEHLRGEGYDVHYEEFDGGHMVPRESVADAFAWWSGAAAATAVD